RRGRRAKGVVVDLRADGERTALRAPRRRSVDEARRAREGGREDGLVRRCRAPPARDSWSLPTGRALLTTKKNLPNGRASPKKGVYDETAIRVLEGLEPVRMRPGMYIGGTDVHGYHHLLREILDNSIDEVINGHARAVVVAMDDDYRGVTIEDDGRG